MRNYYKTFQGKKSIKNITNLQSHRQKNEETDYTEDPAIAKYVAMSVLFLASFLLGVIPIKLNERLHFSTEAKHNFCVRFLLGIGGGVLLCTTFIHLLPEVKANFEHSTINSYFLNKRLAEILLCAGFFMMYFIEECVHSYLHYKEKKMNVIRRGLLIRRGDNLEKILREEEEITQHDSNRGHSHTIEFDATNTSAIIRGLLVVLALSIHELFEGLAVGLETSSRTVWYMFAAVSAHKLVIAFCVGIELVASGLKNSLIVFYVFIFAVVTPLGIGIGIIVRAEKITPLLSVILQGLASGCLVYVIFFEILQGDKRTGLLQFLAIAIGFSMMFGITFLDFSH